jgi:hypothetical protein
MINGLVCFSENLVMVWFRTIKPNNFNSSVLKINGSVIMNFENSLVQFGFPPEPNHIHPYLLVKLNKFVCNHISHSTTTLSLHFIIWAYLFRVKQHEIYLLMFMHMWCSREKFGEMHARLWWEENRARVHEQYLWNLSKDLMLMVLQKSGGVTY